MVAPFGGMIPRPRSLNPRIGGRRDCEIDCKLDSGTEIMVRLAALLLQDKRPEIEQMGDHLWLEGRPLKRDHTIFRFSRGIRTDADSNAFMGFHHGDPFPVIDYHLSQGLVSVRHSIH